MKRITLYAAFDSSGTPMINVYDFNKQRLETLVSDRIANGDAGAGEHVVRITVAKYNRILAERGWGQVRV